MAGTKAIEKRLRAHRAERASLFLAQQELALSTRNDVRHARAAGMTGPEIADLLGVSHQHVYKLLEEAKTTA